ncbi:MAG: discoidin domain-containing protein [Clostridia bacterium]|nr:discoidin domain-containing protein [Clostridia bacterium]
MKKIISLLISAIFILNSASVFADEKEIEYYLEETFDNYETGSQSSKGTVVASENKIYIDEVPDNKDKSLKMEAATEEMSYLEYSTKNIVLDDVFVLEYDVTRIVSNNGVLYIIFKTSDGTNVEIMTLTEGNGIKCGTVALGNLFENVKTKFSLVVNRQAKTYDLYINHKKKMTDIRLNCKQDLDISSVRFELKDMTEERNMPVLYLDNIKAYSGDTPRFLYDLTQQSVKEEKKSNITADAFPDASDYVDYMKDTAVFFTGKNKMLVDGTQKLIDASNTDVKVYVKDGRSFIPVRAVSEAFDAEVEYDEDKKMVYIDRDDTSIVVPVGESHIEINGEKHIIDMSASIENDRVFLPLRAIAEAFDKKVTYDKGLIVIADRENFFNLIDDTGAYWMTVMNLIYENPSGMVIAKTVENRFGIGGHPRIHGNSQKIEDISSFINTNEQMSNTLSELKRSADVLLNAPVSLYETYDCDVIMSRFETLGMAYIFTGDERYAERCWEELESVCKFPDWNPYHFLDTATIMCGMAEAYDWLYDYLDEQQKKTVENAIYEKGLKHVLDDLNNSPGLSRSYKWAQAQTPNNWNFVCCGSAIIAALTFCDVPELKDACIEILDKGMERLKKSPVMFGPDGAWYEGTDYWSYSLNYFVRTMSALLSACGDTYGYMDAPGIRETGYFGFAMQGSNGNVFNFHDSAESKGGSRHAYFLSDVFDDSELFMLKYKGVEQGKQSTQALDLFFLNPEMISYVEDGNSLPKDFYYRGTEVATMRSDWNFTNSVFAGLHAGKVHVTHGQNDAGQFILDGYGERFFLDLGKEDYSLGQSSRDLYRNRAEGHNVLVFNPGEEWDQNHDGVSTIDRFEYNSSSVIAVTDLTDVYSPFVESVKRGIKLVDSRKSVILRDEIKSEKPTDAWWFAHTKNDIEIIEDGKAAILKGTYRDLYVKLLSDVDGVFTVRDAVPFPQSPSKAGQNPNTGVKKLSLNFTAQGDMDVSMYFTFLTKNQKPQDVITPTVSGIDEWKLEAEEEFFAVPTASDIRLDGKTIAGFNKDTMGYTVVVNDKSLIPAIECDSEHKTNIIMPESIPGYAVISVDNGRETTYYTIEFKLPIFSMASNGLIMHPVKKVHSDYVPQPENSPENSIDGNLETRWSAEGEECDIIYDLGSVKNISEIGIAVWQGASVDGRKQSFEIYVSENGVDYEKVYVGTSSGKAVEEEIFDVGNVYARYIKLLCKGTTSGKWNSILEFNAYGKN